MSIWLLLAIAVPSGILIVLGMLAGVGWAIGGCLGAVE
jgi:hypothetical protein